MEAETADEAIAELVLRVRAEGLSGEVTRAVANVEGDLNT